MTSLVGSVPDDAKRGGPGGRHATRHDDRRPSPSVKVLAALIALQTVASVVVAVNQTLAFSDAVKARTIEAVTVADTAYPIPAGALFVDGDAGSDANGGGPSRPLRTIGRAVALSPTGGTVVIRQGVYREGLGYLSKQLTLQPYPHEKVWLKGSMVVTDWTLDAPGVWRHDQWTQRFCRQTTDGQCYLNALIDPAFPTAGLPDMAFVDGAPLAQVASRRAVRPGTFYVDQSTNGLYIGADPTGRTVEASVHKMALQVNNTTGFTVRGLGFMHFASTMAYGNGSATVVFSAPRITFENNTVAWGASSGLAVYNFGGASVKGNTLIYNGFNGMLGNLIDNSAIIGNRIAFNNQEKFWFDNPTHAADADAGAKITRTKHLVVQDNIFEGNYGMGFWCDLSCYDVNITRNVFRNNALYGVFYEVSAKAVIASNLVVSNHRAGIFLSGASQISVYNNTMSRNKHNLYVFEDPRPIQPCTSDTCPTTAELSLGITWDTRNVTVKNNIFSNGDRTSTGLFGRAPDFIHVADGNSPPKYTADEMVTAIDHNAYYRSSTGPRVLIFWTGARYATHSAFRETGRDVHGQAIDGGLTNPFFVDEAAGDYRLRADSLAVGTAAAIPDHVAEAIGAPGPPRGLGLLPLGALSGLSKQRGIVTVPTGWNGAGSERKTVDPPDRTAPLRALLTFVRDLC